jgi:RimJ/RimL family protein N-acetyltransferase
MGWCAGTYDQAAAADFLDHCESNWASGAAYTYAIITDGQWVGVCAIERRIGPGGVEIGYWLHPAHIGRGLATEAVSMLLEQAFALPDVDRVQFWHDAANIPSAGVPRLLGFTVIDRRTPPRAPLASGGVGVDVVWELMHLPG